MWLLFLVEVERAAPALASGAKKLRGFCRDPPCLATLGSCCLASMVATAPQLETGRDSGGSREVAAAACLLARLVLAKGARLAPQKPGRSPLATELGSQVGWLLLSLPALSAETMSIPSRTHCPEPAWAFVREARGTDLGLCRAPASGVIVAQWSLAACLPPPADALGVTHAGRSGYITRSES